ncbi:uncharacterized protein LOC107614101 isoform X2 [Arachis ipaensis]|uniref:uncharacterized protein LOC107614101 isoform X2 n=1 Tax=Arachis ipaensis TaxID=130454 RepID=UPI000A2B1D59|nr:uncharacterized protein LOC107614101 isoform X2 [Arachis ipaensis]XP_025672894.1 uncharacterized protein LOC112772209 isoform X2 [Arachis hypogaea]
MRRASAKEKERMDEEEGMEVLDSALSLINWRLKPSSKRRLQLDMMALSTRLRPVVMVDYGGIMPQLQHHLSHLLQLIHKESPIFEHIRVMVIQDMIYLIHLLELAEYVKSSFNNEIPLLFVDLQHEPPKMVTNIEESPLALQLVSIQKLFLTLFPTSPPQEGTSNNDPAPTNDSKCVDDDADLASKRVHSHSAAECIDLSSCMDNTDVTVPTLNGNNTLKKGTQAEELLSFSVPYDLSIRGSNEQWAEAFMANMRTKFERCANAWKSLKMEVSECNPQAIVL